MSSGQRVNLDVAQDAAELLTTTLAYVCERQLVAGSIRRRRDNVKDIELVVIPRRVALGGSIEVRGILESVGARLQRGGERAMHFDWDPCPIDLYVASPETWGCIATIRTGSAEFSHWLVTPRMDRGGCPLGMRFQDGRLWRGSIALDTPEEEEVFRALSLPCIPPEQREQGVYLRAMCAAERRSPPQPRGATPCHG